MLLSRGVTGYRLRDQKKAESEEELRDQRDDTVGKVLALHVANLSRTPGMPYGLLSPQE